MLTASLTGSALGAAVAGALAQQAGPAGAFAFVGGAGVAAVLVAAARSSSLAQITSRA